MIDSHALIHRFFHALPPLTTPAGEPIQAVYGLANIILKIYREMKPEYLGAAFDRPEPTFREKIFEEYKIHRPPAAQELISQFKTARRLFDVMGVRIVELPGFEADDVIGSVVERFKNTPDLRIEIISGDLDLLQLVEDDRVVVRFLQKGMSDMALYNEEAVRSRYGITPKQLPDLKGLLGDTSDNIPGVKGIGPKTATPLIQKYTTLENLLENIWELPEKIGGKIEEKKAIALLSKQLAIIRRDAPVVADSLEEFLVQPLNQDAVISHFQSWGFTSLMERLRK